MLGRALSRPLVAKPRLRAVQNDLRFVFVGARSYSATCSTATGIKQNMLEAATAKTSMRRQQQRVMHTLPGRLPNPSSALSRGARGGARATLQMKFQQPRIDFSSRPIRGFNETRKESPTDGTVSNSYAGENQVIRTVSESELVEVPVDRSDPNTSSSKERPVSKVALAKISTDHLSRLIEVNDISHLREAWEFFHELSEAKQTDEHICTVMMKACHNSDDQRRFINENMPKAGVEANTATYNSLVNQLMVEGDVESAHQVMDEMLAAGVKPNERTFRALNLTEKILDHERTKRLSNFLARGGKANEQWAWDLFNTLKKRGKASVYQFNLMMKFCYDSEEQRRLIEFDMPVAGVKPNVVTYTTLVSRLMLEGNASAARRVISEEMPAAGVEPDAYSWRALEKPAKSLSRMRTKQLSECLARRTPRAMQGAWNLFNKLVEKDEVDMYQVNTMMKACRSSEEQQKHIDEVMKRSGMKPDASTYNTLVNSLIYEGNFSKARAVLNEEMLASGVKPDSYTYALLEKMNNNE